MIKDLNRSILLTNSISDVQGSDNTTGSTFINLTGNKNISTSEIGKTFIYTSSTSSTYNCRLCRPIFNGYDSIWITNNSLHTQNIIGNINGVESNTFSLLVDSTIKLKLIGRTWKIVMERWEPSASATSHTFAGLNGDVDRNYAIREEIIPANSQTGTVYLKMNSDAGSNYLGQFLEAANTSVSGAQFSSAGGFQAGYFASTSILRNSNQLQISAKSGVARTARYETMKWDGSVVSNIQNMGFVWTNTADNITSMTVSFGTNGFGVGTCIELWKTGEIK